MGDRKAPTPAPTNQQRPAPPPPPPARRHDHAPPITHRAVPPKTRGRPDDSPAAVVAEALEHRAQTLADMAMANQAHPELGTPVQLMARVSVLRAEADRARGHRG